MSLVKKEWQPNHLCQFARWRRPAEFHELILVKSSVKTLESFCTVSFISNDPDELDALSDALHEAATMLRKGV